MAMPYTSAISVRKSSRLTGGKLWPSTLTVVGMSLMTTPSLRQSASSLSTRALKSGVCVSVLGCSTASAGVP